MTLSIAQCYTITGLQYCSTKLLTAHTMCITSLLYKTTQQLMLTDNYIYSTSQKSSRPKTSCDIITRGESV